MDSISSAGVGAAGTWGTGGADPDEILAGLAIQNISGIGPTYAKRLVETAGSFKKILEAGKGGLKDAGVPEAYLGRIPSQRQAAIDQAEKQMRAAESKGIHVTVLTDPRYPTRLKEIPDPPAALYIYGEVQASDELSVGIVGTRKATDGGLRFAEEVGRELASIGVTVVSGLALGIDAAAHKGALEADGGRTVAVLGTGVDICYPSRNRNIYDRIRLEGRGALVSEFPPGTEPQAFHFPMRNRIISGLTLGVVVVEAPERSGALITARTALEQGREVFAVPHSARSAAGAGANRLIREGAHLVEKVEDILLVIEYQAKLIRAQRPTVEISAGVETAAVRPESKIYDIIRQGVAGLDDLVERSGEPVSAVLAEITRLEIDGKIRQAAAGAWRPTHRTAEPAGA